MVCLDIVVNVNIVKKNVLIDDEQVNHPSSSKLYLNNLIKNKIKGNEYLFICSTKI